MDKRISCKGLYNLINNKELIASGSGANLYKYSNNSLFKFRAGYFTETLALDKEDMANMAESFISLTSLVRRMQPGEETVGGPVDVAVISKGDGFVWINRKHYFRPELNAPFFNNYFK